MKKLIFSCLWILCITSCKKEDSIPAVLIRVNNQLSHKIGDVTIFSSTAKGGQVEKRYGAVSPGSFTLYLSHQVVASLPLLRYTIPGSGAFEVSNIRCAVGLSFLESGKYSLVIKGESSSPVVLFIKD